MVISITKSIKSKWLKQNNKFYQNNSLIKPQYTLMEDKLKPDIKLPFLDLQFMLLKTDLSELDGETIFQDLIFCLWISTTHSSQIKHSSNRYLLFPMHMESLPTHQVTDNLKHIGL